MKWGYSHKCIWWMLFSGSIFFVFEFHRTDIICPDVLCGCVSLFSREIAICFSYVFCVWVERNTQMKWIYIDFYPIKLISWNRWSQINSLEMIFLCFEEMTNEYFHLVTFLRNLLTQNCVIFSHGFMMKKICRTLQVMNFMTIQVGNFRIYSFGNFSQIPVFYNLYLTWLKFYSALELINVNFFSFFERANEWTHLNLFVQFLWNSQIYSSLQVIKNQTRNFCECYIFNRP